MDANALTMQGIVKRFPGTVAVDGVDFDLRVGEVHALMGENGAGKSTLMKTLTGCFDDYEGSIRINGRETVLHSPASAKEQGIGMVYQELSLARPISIAENLLAGRLPVTRLGLIDRNALQREARRCLELTGLSIDPRRTIEEISPHEAQLAEIAKVLGNRPCILILDEPTSALSREEAQRLFHIIRQLKRGGLAIIYITHHLPEVFEIADRVTVMRDGKKAGTYDIGEVTPETLVRMMVGKTAGEFYAGRQGTIGGPVLRVEHLTRLGFFHDVSFTLNQGEILGVAGLSGAGRTELARSLCGLDPVDFGCVYLSGEEIPLEDYPHTAARGILYLSEDRKEEGLFLRLSLRTNLLAARPRLLAKPGRTPLVQRFIEELDIAAASEAVDVGTLSGGISKRRFSENALPWNRKCSSLTNRAGVWTCGPSKGSTKP